MFRRPTKKQLLIQRIVLYSIMTVSVITIVTGIVLFILGYRLDSVSGRLAQGALVQFDSTPEGADVTIDGEHTGNRTASKRTVLAGLHNFLITKDGYHPWEKSLTLQAGTLTWLDYIRLVPTTLQPETIATYDKVYDEIASPDRRKLLLQERAAVPTFQLIDISDRQVRTSTIELPRSLYSEGTKHTFAMSSWDAGGRFVLLRHVYDKKTEWLVLDTQNLSRSTNVSRPLGLALDDVRFAGTNGNLLFGLTDGTVRKLDLSNETISRALITNVTTFDLFETNIITYVGTNSDGTRQVAGIYRDGDDAAHVLRTVNNLTTPLHIDATRYFSDDYVAIAQGAVVTVLKGRYPSSSRDDTTSLQRLAEFEAVDTVDQLTFSPRGSYVVARSDRAFASYEVEHQRLSRAVIETDSTREAPDALQWLDLAYLWTVYDNTLSIREFDGTNIHTIMTMERDMDATLSQNGRYIYGVARSADGSGYVLQRVTMILE